mgnify:CR=1 FL=1
MCRTLPSNHFDKHDWYDFIELIYTEYNRMYRKKRTLGRKNKFKLGFLASDFHSIPLTSLYVLV